MIEHAHTRQSWHSDAASGRGSPFHSLGVTTTRPCHALRNAGPFCALWTGCHRSVALASPHEYSGPILAIHKREDHSLYARPPTRTSLEAQSKSRTSSRLEAATSIRGAYPSPRCPAVHNPSRSSWLAIPLGLSLRLTSIQATLIGPSFCVTNRTHGCGAPLWVQCSWPSPLLPHSQPAAAIPRCIPARSLFFRDRSSTRCPSLMISAR